MFNDVKITVGAFGCELRDPATSAVRSVPLLPVIVADFSPGPIPTGVPKQLEIDATDLRYALYEPGYRSTPFLSLDEQTSQDAHELFQRLWKHWNYYFIRLIGAEIAEPATAERSAVVKTTVADLQVCTGGKAYVLKSSLESGLECLRLSREKLIEVALGGDELLRIAGNDPAQARQAAISEVDKWVTLVGSLPAIGPDEQLLPGGAGALPPDAVRVKYNRAESIRRCRECSRPASSAHNWETVYCDAHVAEREAKFATGKFVRKLDKQNAAIPCFRCGKVGPRYRYIVRIDGKERDVCMDCADTITGGESFQAASKSQHDLVVETYLDLMRSLGKDARLSDKSEAGQRFRWCYSALRDARVYEMPKGTYEKLKDLSTAYVTSVVGEDLRKLIGDVDRIAEGSKEEQLLEAKIVSLAQTVPMPEPLPFDTIYIGWGNIQKTVKGDDGAMLIGTIISAKPGRIIEIIAESDDKFRTLGIRDELSWGRYSFLSAWIYTMLVEALNDYRTIVNQQSSLKMRLALKSASKKAKKQFLPRPFYTVTLQNKVLNDAHKSTKTKLSIPREWSHRWDVHGHERLYIRRGPLPLDSKTKRRYQRLGFDVFEHPKQLSGEAYAVILKRAAKPMQVGEWLAVKRTRIEAYQKPKDRGDLPFVPAVRKPKKGLVAQEGSR